MSKKIESTVEFTLNGAHTFSFEARKAHFHLNTQVNGQPSLRPTLTGVHKSKEIIGAAFGDCCSNEFFLSSLVNENSFGGNSFQGWKFKSTLRDPHTELFKGMLDVIFYRALATFGYGRMDDLASYSIVSHAWNQGEFVRDLYRSSASRDFLKFQYLPYVFAYPEYPAFALCQEVIKKLKSHGEYNSYVDGLMKSSNPKKWEFAAFHGVQKSTGLYIRGLKDFDKIPFDEHHPLMHAIQNGHLKIVQYLTRNGKLLYWKAAAGSVGEERPVLKALGKCSSLPTVKLLIENNPDLLSNMSDMDDVPRQCFLNCANTPEIFDYLRAQLGLELHELHSCRDAQEPDQNVSILDVVLCGASDAVIRHIFHICPDIPVTGNTLQQLYWRRMDPDIANRSLEIDQAIIDKYDGDWDSCAIEGTPILEFLMDAHHPVAMLEMILPKLDKGTLIEGKSPYVYCAELPYLFPDCLWLLARHHFPWPEHIKPRQSYNEPTIKSIRWLFNQQNPGDVPPTLGQMDILESHILQNHPALPNPIYAILKADFDARRQDFKDRLEYQAMLVEYQAMLDSLSSTS